MGTHFFLAAKQTSTWLEVVDGWVSLRRTEDGVVSKVARESMPSWHPVWILVFTLKGRRWQTPYSVVMKPTPGKDASEL